MTARREVNGRSEMECGNGDRLGMVSALVRPRHCEDFGKFAG
jgi:hypothetical protein